MVLLSYIGGKARAADRIAAVIPSDVQTLVSPFFGAGSVEFFCALNGMTVLGFDIFLDLVSFWQTLKAHPQRFKKEVEGFVPMNKTAYQTCKNRLRQNHEHSFQRAVDFFVVNKCSFNGIMSGSYSRTLGDMFSSTPKRLGKFKFPPSLSVYCQSFQTTIDAHPTAFLFLDPPYYGIGKTYGISGEFSTIDHEELAQKLQSHVGRWLLVYNDHSWVRERYKDFCITDFLSRYGSNRRGAQLLISNYSRQ